MKARKKRSKEYRPLTPEQWRKRACRQYERERAKSVLLNFLFFVAFSFLLGLCAAFVRATQ